MSASKEKLLALAAQQHHPNANTPTLTSHNLLAITLHWLRRKPTYNELSYLYPHSGFFWHLMVRKVVAALDGCISSRFVPSLASNAPTAVRFPNVKIIVDTTFVPLPKTPFIPADYHKKSPTKAALEIRDRLRLQSPHYQRFERLPRWRTRYAHHP